MSLFDYLPAAVSIAALFIGYLLASSSIRKVIHEEQTKNEPVQALLKQMGLRGHLTDLNKLSPQAFQMLRQLIFDFRQLAAQDSGSGKVNSTVAMLQALSGIKAGQQATQLQQQPAADGGVQS